MLHQALLLAALSVGLADPSADAPLDAPVETPIVAVTAPGDRWALMRHLQGTYYGWLLDGNRIRVYGWTEGSFTGGTASPESLPHGLNYRANEFLVQQNMLRIERPVITTGTTDPTFGFRSDTILPGTDYRFTIARGLFSQQLSDNDGEPNTYGFDPVQFYIEAYVPTIGRGLDVKLGRFYSPFGVESVDATQTPFCSRTYTFLYNPFTNTGVLANIQRTESWSFQSGLVAGDDIFIGNDAANPTVIKGFKWAPPNGRNSVQFTAIIGSGRYDVENNFNNPEIFDLVFTHKCNDRLTFTINTLFGFQTGVPDVGTATWFGIVNYLSCALSPRLTANARLEFFDDIDGNRTGFAGLYTGATAGLNFRPTAAVMFRPELRYDYNSESRPYEGRHGLLTAAADVVVRW